jgi:hypothetical protein
VDILFKKLFIKSKSVSGQSSKEQFNDILNFAKSVLNATNRTSRDNGIPLKSDQHPLIDIIRLVGRKLQTQYITDLLTQKNETDLPSLFPENVFLCPLEDALTEDGRRLYDLIKEVNLTKELFLNKDLVLPWPWKRKRLINCIAQIGQGRANGSWRQDHNHRVELWLPIGVGWVRGGNHSITAGIIQGEGSIVSEKIYDISELYNYVYSDGEYYYRIEDLGIIAPVKNMEFAAIFEIGRIMTENGISF